jgi:hypothetical protein
MIMADDVLLVFFIRMHLILHKKRKRVRLRTTRDSWVN